MNDEFDVNVEDGSGEEIAALIVGLRKQTLQGDFQKVDELYRSWVERKSRGGGGRLNFQQVSRDEDDDDTDWDSDDMNDDDVEDDVSMGEASTSSQPPREKVIPKVDEDGFTEVVGRRRR